MKDQLEFHVIKDFINAYGHYKSSLYDYLYNNSSVDQKALRNYWNYVEIHIVNQTWGSTACGWGGMGGAAITGKYNIIFYNKYLEILSVYWDGQLAYVIPYTKNIDFGQLPSLDKVKDTLYINKRR